METSTTIEISKCFLVQLRDAEGNEISYQYVFSDTKAEAAKVGKRMQKDYIKKQKDLKYKERKKKR